MSEVKIASSDFVEHGCEQEKILAIDQQNFHIWVEGQRLFQAQRCVQTAESASQDDDAFASTAAHETTSQLLVRWPRETLWCGTILLDVRRPAHRPDMSHVRFILHNSAATE